MQQCGVDARKHRKIYKQPASAAITIDIPIAPIDDIDETMWESQGCCQGGTDCIVATFKHVRVHTVHVRTVERTGDGVERN